MAENPLIAETADPAAAGRAAAPPPGAPPGTTSAAAPIALSSAASRSAAARARLRERVARLHAERSAAQAPSVHRVDAV